MNYYNQFGIYQPFRVSLLEPQQSNLSNQEAYLEPCQISKMKCFAMKLLTFLVKDSILDVWQGSEYTSVCNLLLIFWENWERE